MESAVRLQPEPQSAGVARAWIRDQLTSMGRPELVDSAQLATSELVTNAVLHARTRITVAVRAEGDEIFIEVADASANRLAPPIDAGSGALATVGNGLQIIGALARRWGVRERDQGGKTVWFVPSSPEEEVLAAPRFPPDLLEGIGHDDTDTVEVVVQDAPVRLLWETRFRVRDVRREMTLLTMQPGAPAEVSQRMVELAGQVEQVHAAVLTDDEAFEQAVARGDESITLRYLVPRTTGPACAQLADLFEEADEYCRSAQLLTLAAPPAERALRRWFLGEFARQAAGRPATPWEHPATV